MQERAGVRDPGRTGGGRWRIGPGQSGAGAPLAPLLLPLLLALAGCFAYVPTEPAAVAVEDRVRARVESATGERIAAATGGAYRETVAGQVTALRADTLVLSVPVRGAAGAAHGQPLSHMVPVPADAIRSLELRVLDRRRTALASVGAATLLGYILYQAFIRTDAPGSNGENNPPVDESIAPAGGSR